MTSSIEQARRVLEIEARAILSLRERLNDSFEEAVRMIVGCRGKVIVAGMGKSGQVCRKIAATLASTGTPAFFMHPAEGIHGDLGMVAKGDLVIAISNSGETEELLQVLPSLKRLDVPLIAMTGKPKSTLAQVCDVVLDLSVGEEACPMGLAPTASTTATLALGDALAIAVLQKRGFNENDFALLHPGGSLGRKLLLKVSDLMKVGGEIPLVSVNSDISEVLIEMTSKRLGVTGVMDEDQKLAGVITDGDLRRHLKNKTDLFSQKASHIMSRNPKTIGEKALAQKAVHLMEEYKITTLFIIDQKSHPIGIIHLHDLLKAKLA